MSVFALSREKVQEEVAQNFSWFRIQNLKLEKKKNEVQMTIILPCGNFTPLKELKWPIRSHDMTWICFTRVMSNNFFSQGES